MSKFLDTISRVKRYLMPKLSILLNNRGEVEVPPVTDPPVTDPPPVVGNWKENLPPEIKDHPVFEKYNEPNDAYKALVSAQKFLGAETLPVPKDVDDKEAHDMIYKKLGLPETPNDYVLPTDLKIPEGMPVSEPMLNNFKAIAHEKGLSPKQFSDIYKWYMDTASQQFEAHNKAMDDSAKQAETGLRTKWGSAYGQNVALAKKVFHGFADEKAFAAFEQKYGNDPVMIELFANLGKVLGEDQLAGKPTGLSFTPVEAQSEIDKIKGDMKHPYWIATHPHHKQAVERMDQLTRMLG